jgi:hypothetical protein
MHTHLGDTHTKFEIKLTWVEFNMNYFDLSSLKSIKNKLVYLYNINHYFSVNIEKYSQQPFWKQTPSKDYKSIN